MKKKRKYSPFLWLLMIPAQAAIDIVWTYYGALFLDMKMISEIEERGDMCGHPFPGCFMLVGFLSVCMLFGMIIVSIAVICISIYKKGI